MSFTFLSSQLSPHDIVRSGLCVGCGSCVYSTGIADCKMILDRFGHFKPAGPSAWYRGSTPHFSKICPFSAYARDETLIAKELFAGTMHTDNLIGKYLTNYVGYVMEDDFRIRGNSGGMATWLMLTLLRNGDIDGAIQVAPTSRNWKEEYFFEYRISRSEEEINQCAKSRYYPVELSSVLSNVKAHPGRYALIGVPCYIKAVRLLCAEDSLMRDRIKYTIGLVCGHMKSARFLESIALQSGTTVDDIRNFNFRIKEPDLAARNYVAEFTLRNGCSVRKAWWDLVDGDWGAGFFQNSACNFCDDVVAETADISLGDAWVEPYASDPEGNNVLIVRSEAFHRILEDVVRKNKLCLKTVGPDFVEQTQTAGFRQRREGLAYRLCCSHSDNIPRKRVAPECKDLPFTRRIIYRTRKHISFWSHRVFRMAVAARCPALYDKWARFLSGLYQGITYKRGPLGAFLKSVEFYSK